jgi:hypothetical protein
MSLPHMVFPAKMSCVMMRVVATVGVGDEHDLEPVMSSAKAMLLMKLLSHSFTHTDLAGMTN